MLSRPRTDERGSLVITISVLVVLALLSASLLVRNFGVTRQLTRGQNFSASLASADGGLSDALFKLDQSVPTATPACVPEPCTSTGTVTLGNGSTASYRGTRIDVERYGFEVKGSISGVPHAVTAEVVRKLRYPYALFAKTSITLNGNTTGKIISDPLGQARIGSNGIININGSGGGDFQDYYTPDGQCINCPNGVNKDGPYIVSDPIVPAGLLQACPPPATSGPNAGKHVFTSTIAGGSPYACTNDVVMRGPISVTGQVQIFVPANRSLKLDGSINEGPSTSSANLILNKAGTGVLDFVGGSQITAVVNAPSSNLTVPPNVRLKGSLVIDNLTINGAATFQLVWDQKLQIIVEKPWAVRYWKEVPSGSVSV